MAGTLCHVLHVQRCVDFSEVSENCRGLLIAYGLYSVTFA
jgi:hypothetical protein